MPDTLREFDTLRVVADGLSKLMQAQRLAGDITNELRLLRSSNPALLDRLIDQLERSKVDGR